MLTTHSATEIAAKANEFVADQDFFSFGELMLHDLNGLRRTVPETLWCGSLVPQLRAEPFYPRSQEDPFSKRATTKPRGYAGDAHLIDFLYRSDSVGEEVVAATPAGQAIYNYWMNSPAAKAVRDRMRFFRHQLVRTVSRTRKARVLVLACGHFREGDIVIDNDAFDHSKITCLDQDAESCAEVEKRFDASSVTVIHNRISTVLRLNDTKFDLIYAAGLYDYLNDRIAIRLNAHLVSILSHGGRLVVPNFLRSAPNRASMELLQNWFLIYRDEIEITKLLSDAGAASVRYFADDHDSIGYAVFDRC